MVDHVHFLVEVQAEVAGVEVRMSSWGLQSPSSWCRSPFGKVDYRGSAPARGDPGPVGPGCHRASDGSDIRSRMACRRSPPRQECVRRFNWLQIAKVSGG